MLDIDMGWRMNESLSLSCVPLTGQDCGITLASPLALKQGQ